MSTEVIILTLRDLDTTDVNLIKIINFCGLKCKVINLSSSDGFIDHLESQISEDDPSLMINSNFLATIFPNQKHADNFRSFLVSKISFVMVYNVFPDDLQNSAIEHLSYGAFRSVNSHETSHYKYKVTDDFNDICKQFSGLHFDTGNKNFDFTLNIGNPSREVSIFSLISLNKLPFFVKLKIEDCNLFILANNKVLDIDTKIGDHFNLKESFSQFIPLMMFIKYVFGDRCWHSKNSKACLIIDDPLLRKNYGFLNYKKLLGFMDQNDFFTDIAFIPWNYKRTREEGARLFRERTDRFMLCVHGYAHTNNEFGINDFDELNRKVKLATARMKDHEKSTGVKFDEVIVFPQGKFSSKAMKALKSNNYLASVNTDLISTDAPEGLKISDFLDVAIMNYCCFPLFIRRYPKELVDFAFDLFMGKPVFIVEHHDCFRDGYDKIIDFIRSINLFDENIHWDGLGKIIKKSYLERKSLNGNNYIRIYSNKCEIENTSNNHNIYTVTKKECDDVPISTVMVDGKDASYRLEEQFLTLQIEIPGRTSVSLEIIYEDCYLNVVGKDTLKEKIEVYFRRYLSEIRDNFISKNEFLLSMANKVIKLKQKF